MECVKMIKRAVRDFQSDTRLCDVIVEESKTYLEIKDKDRNGKTVFRLIPWNDFKIQVESAEMAAAK